jgi:hypothetical protein
METLWTNTPYKASDSVLCSPFVFCDSLRVGIEGDTAGGMPEQFLGDFDVRTAGPQ